MPTISRARPSGPRRWGRSLVALAVAVSTTLTVGVASGGPAAAAVAAPAVQDGYAVANNGAVASVDLAGTWNFTPLDPAAGTTTIQVPGGGWIKQGFTTTKEARYSRTVTIPSTGGPQTVMLELGAVNHQATLRIGSTVVGTRTTSFTPSTFDLTPHVSAGGTYTLTLDVKGREALTQNGKYLVPEAAEWSKEVPQGIYRSAFVRVYPQTYIEDTFVRTSVADGTVTYDVSVRNTSSTARTVTLGGSFSSHNGSSFSYPSVPARSVTVPANSTTTETVGPLAWTPGAASYWWPNVPYVPGYRAQLHVLTTTLGGASTQTVKTRFGFREFTQPPNQTRYYLNGVAVNLRGDNLQGADYDRIDNGGKGDAFDTLPGFLPPTSTNGGWPKAVDNMQRLNFNVVRLHQEVPSPYMVDVLDEMGLMAIGESAIRGSAGRQDFVNGRDNMVQHVRDLVLRDRNHPSVIEWSQANEPRNTSPHTDSEQFQKDLFNAIRGLDPTRPIIIDGASLGTYPGMTPANGYTQFNTVAHYVDGFSAYGTWVDNKTTTPNGEGEYIWPGTSTKNGATLFATSTLGKRGKGAADLRPYTLLSTWAGFVPGVRTTDFVTEEGRNPVYGEDNLADPWSNPQINLIQKAFNPLAAVDLQYWDASGRSDSIGSFPLPASAPVIGFNKSVTRTITVFNDALSGTSVGFSWTARAGSTSGPVIGSGSTTLTIPLGGRVSTPVTFTSPSSGPGVYLTLTTTRNGSTVFTDSSQFLPLGPASSVDDATSGTTAGTFAYTGTWGLAGGESGPFQGTNSYSKAAGDTARFPFTGTRISYHAIKGPNHGKVAVSVDGGPETEVDLYSAGRTPDVLVYQSPVVTEGSHQLTVRVTGTKNAAASDVYGTVDRVDVQKTAAAAYLGLQSGRCLNLDGSGGADGAKVDIRDCDGGTPQAWALNAASQLVNAASGKCLDVAGEGTADGTAVQQWSCHGGSNQKWTYDSYQRLVSQASGKCLDVNGNKTANGSRLVIWACGSGNNQKWLKQ